ncbi:MAG: site-specific DNA-methyltransferase [Euryarchaeota archaeon CG01_land_8_20_14_3_00_38_12]|nr:MAG: site-specific DNA-methyltransferase [Euryarchaeota archaeon CG01_land_8_20_14_3_00_38_12]
MDCIVGLAKLPEKCVDLIISDPPYFKTINEEWDYKWRTEDDYIEWVEKWVKELSKVAKTNCSFWLFGYVKILSRLLPLIEGYGFIFRQQIIVDKGMRSISGRKTSTYKMFPTTTESIFFFVKNNQPNIKKFLRERQKEVGLSAKEINEKLEVKSNGGGMWSLYTGENILAQIPTEEMWKKLQEILNFKMDYSEVNFTFNPQMGFTDVWRDIDFYKEKRNHSTQKPTKLIERIILASSNEGMLVLDPFMGSGTTAVVARKLKRNFIGFEIDKKYYDSSLLRLKQKTIM